MPTGIIVEIVADANGDLPTRLIAAAYRASTSTPVALVLRSVVPATVDRVLDPVVRSTAGVRGVRYLIGANDAPVCEAAASAILVIAETAEFRRRLRHCGVSFLDANEGLRELERTAHARMDVATSFDGAGSQERSLAAT